MEVSYYISDQELPAWALEVPSEWFEDMMMLSGYCFFAPIVGNA